MKIRLIGTGYQEYYQADVKIYDEENNLICKTKTYNGELNLNLLANKTYHIEANLLGTTLKSSFYTNKCEFVFIFPYSYKRNQTNSTTFRLTDKVYKNLPIEKGKILLWINK